MWEGEKGVVCCLEGVGEWAEVLQGAQRKEGGFGGGVFFGDQVELSDLPEEEEKPGAPLLGHREQQVPGQVGLSALPALGRAFSCSKLELKLQDPLSR